MGYLFSGYKTPVVKCKVVLERGNIRLSDLFAPIIVNVHIIGIRDGKE